MTSNLTDFHVFDTRLARVASDYPNPHGRGTLVAALRLHYLMTSTSPKLTDFKATRSFGLDNKPCYGPINTCSLEGTKVAISRFCRLILGLPLAIEIDDESEDPLATPCTYYITCSDDTWLEKNDLSILYHRSTPKLYLDDFYISGKRSHMDDDPSICTHSLSRDELKDKDSLQAIHAYVAGQHIQKCLHKTVAGPKRPESADVFTTHALQEGKLPENAPDNWRSVHPYFGNLVYDSSSGDVIIKREEFKGSDPVLKDVYDDAIKGLQIGDQHKAALTKMFKEMEARYRTLGYLTTDLFAYMHTWRITELIRILMVPPSPVTRLREGCPLDAAAGLQLSNIPDISMQNQWLGFLFRSKARYVSYPTVPSENKSEVKSKKESKSKPKSKGKGKKVASAKTTRATKKNQETLLAVPLIGELDVFRATFEGKGGFGKVGDVQYAYLKGDTLIRQFLRFLASGQALNMPMSYLLPSWDPVEDVAFVQALMQSNRQSVVQTWKMN